MRTSSLLQPRGAPEISWTVPRNASTRSRRGTFSTRRTCSVKSTGRVVESILFETCSPIKPVLATPLRDERRGDFVFSCPSCFRCARHASGRRRVRSRFPRKPKETNGGRYRIRTNALACECAPPPPPCVEYSAVPMIFLGTVTETIEAGLFRMRVDKAYKGISEETVILYDSGMCDGPSLYVGEQYLMYTHDDGSGYLPFRGCTRSRNVKYAEEDLAFLNSLPGAAPTGTISGHVTMRTGGVTKTGNPLSGASVEISNNETKATTTTDSSGRYSFAGLQPGSYGVTASKPGFTSNDFEEDDATVEARGCAVVNLLLNKNWPGTIRGRVIRSDGTPVQPGLSLDLIRVEGKGRRSKVGASDRLDRENARERRVFIPRRCTRLL